MEAEAIKRCFDVYCSWLEQEANLEKSKYSFIKILKKEDKKWIMETGF